MTLLSRKTRSYAQAPDEAFDFCITGISFVILPVGFAILLAQTEWSNRLLACGSISLDISVAAVSVYKALSKSSRQFVGKTQAHWSLIFSGQSATLVLAVICLLAAFLLRN
jgi:hypothetical protein